MTYPGGRTLTYNYRDDDRLGSIEDSAGGTVSYGYDDGNDLTLVQYPNGTKKEIDYNELHQMVTLANEKNDDTVIRAYGFEYDPLGNKTHIAESDNTGPVMGRNYTYDALSRLTSEEINSQTTTYSYDALGNRLSKISGDSITGYEYNGLNQLMKMGSATPELSETITVTGTVTDAQSVTVNGLNAPIANGEYSREIELVGGWNTINVTATSAGGKQAHRSVDVFLAGDSTNFIYDNNGNMTHKTDTTGTINYGYDPADRLSLITYPDSRPATSYTYNGRNKKVSQTLGGDVTKYLWDGDQIIRELNAGGQPVATLVHGLGLGADVGSIVKTERGGQNQFFHYDWRGSVTALTDQTAQTVQTYLYDSFGNVTDSSGSAVNPYQFSSKQFDVNSGLSYFGMRHYHSQLGRFTTQDPKEYVDGLNTYAYVKNNPINLVDVAGLAAATVVCDGHGGFEVNLGWAEDTICSIQECVQEHEENHLEDIAAEYPDICRYSNGNPKPEGTEIRVPDSFRIESECHAHIEEADCLQNYIDSGKLSDEDRQRVQDELDNNVIPDIDKYC